MGDLQGKHKHKNHHHNKIIISLIRIGERNVSIIDKIPVIVDDFHSSNLLSKAVGNDITSPLHDSLSILILIQVRVGITNGRLNHHHMITNRVVVIHAAQHRGVRAEDLEMTRNEVTILLLQIDVVYLVDTVHKVKMRPGVLANENITAIIYS